MCHNNRKRVKVGIESVLLLAILLSEDRDRTLSAKADI